MAFYKTMQVNVYDTGGNLPTPPATVDISTYSFVEQRFFHIPELLNTYPTPTVIFLDNGDFARGFEDFVGAVPDYPLLSGFYNWSVTAPEFLYSYFQNIHNYEARTDRDMLYKFEHGYLYSQGGSASNPQTSVYDEDGNLLFRMTNACASYDALLIAQYDDLGDYINFASVKLSYIPNTGIRANTNSITYNDGASFNDLKAFFDLQPSITPGEDPYDPGGTSTTGGGTGTFDGTGDAISFPSLPTLSAVSTGFVTLYAPTITQLNSLASYMWSGSFDITLFRKLFADPMDVILGLSIVPVAVPISGMQEVKVGNISTGVSMNKVSTQYVNVDCGTLQVKEYWGSCLDYAPNSKCQIYLPYIGTRSIDIDEIMGKTIQVKYAVDVLSGALVANIMCGSSVLYSFTGACASSIPVVSRDFTSIISSAINIAGSIGMAVATGGLSTPVTAASAVQLGVAAGQTAMNVANSKPSVQHSGAAGGTSGMLGVQTPYLIFELPRQSLPQGYNKYGGYPANITLQLGSITGFTKVEMIHLENIPATDSELNEIETLLKAGVIL